MKVKGKLSEIQFFNITVDGMYFPYDKKQCLMENEIKIKGIFSVNIKNIINGI